MRNGSFAIEGALCAPKSEPGHGACAAAPGSRSDPAIRLLCDVREGPVSPLRLVVGHATLTGRLALSGIDRRRWLACFRHAAKQAVAHHLAHLRV